MRLNIVLAIVVIVASANSCESLVETFYRITVSNNGSDTVYFYENSEGGAFHYPDTTIQTSQPSALVRPGRKFYGIDSRTEWETIVQNLPADTLSFFFFDSITVKTNSWESIRSNYLVRYRYDLSIQDLQNLGFDVPVPPSTSMQGMKVYAK